MSLRISFLSMNETWKQDWISINAKIIRNMLKQILQFSKMALIPEILWSLPDEENWGVISNLLTKYIIFICYYF